MQTRRNSLFEAIANVVIGFVINVSAQHIIFPLFGFDIPWGDNIVIALIFTVISVARSYTLRRMWNALDRKSG